MREISQLGKVALQSSNKCIIRKEKENSVFVSRKDLTQRIHLHQITNSVKK